MLGEAVNFDSQILLHLNEIWGLLTVIAHLSLRSPMFGERHFGVLFGMLKFNLILRAFGRSSFDINPHMISSIPLNVRDTIKDAFFTKHRWASIQMLLNTFQIGLLLRKRVAPDPVSLFFKEKVSSSERHMWVHLKAAAANKSILYWFYNYLLKASFEARRVAVSKRRSQLKSQFFAPSVFATPLR